jgi:hypothetical protein
MEKVCTNKNHSYKQNLLLYRVTSTIYVTSIHLESKHLENRKSKNLEG